MMPTMTKSYKCIHHKTYRCLFDFPQIATEPVRLWSRQAHPVEQLMLATPQPKSWWFICYWFRTNVTEHHNQHNKSGQQCYHYCIQITFQFKCYRTRVKCHTGLMSSSVGDSRPMLGRVIHYWGGNVIYYHLNIPENFLKYSLYRLCRLFILWAT